MLRKRLPAATVLSIVLLLMGLALAGCLQVPDDPEEMGDQDPAGSDPDGAGDDEGEEETGNDDSGEGADDGDDNGDDNGESDDDNDTGDDPPSEVALELQVQDPVERLVAGDTVAIVVDVTGDEAEADWAGLRWSTESTAGDDAPEVAGFDGELEGDNLSFPGDYTVSDWGPSEVGTYFVRGHLEVGEQDFWSDEFEVEVVSEVEEGEFEADVVVSITPGVSLNCDNTASFDPDPVEIEVGQVVQWVNEDGCTHSATHDVPSEDRLFDTGFLDGDESSSSFRFNKAGEYDYFCVPHGSDQMSGTIIVTA